MVVRAGVRWREVSDWEGLLEEMGRMIGPIGPIGPIFFVGGRWSTMRGVGPVMPVRWTFQKGAEAVWSRVWSQWLWD